MKAVNFGENYMINENTKQYLIESLQIGMPKLLGMKFENLELGEIRLSMPISDGE